MKSAKWLKGKARKKVRTNEKEKPEREREKNQITKRLAKWANWWKLNEKAEERKNVLVIVVVAMVTLVKKTLKTDSI